MKTHCLKIVCVSVRVKMNRNILNYICHRMISDADILISFTQSDTDMLHLLQFVRAHTHRHIQPSEVLKWHQAHSMLHVQTACTQLSYLFDVNLSSSHLLTTPTYKEAIIIIKL